MPQWVAAAPGGLSRFRRGEGSRAPLAGRRLAWPRSGDSPLRCHAPGRSRRGGASSKGSPSVIRLERGGQARAGSRGDMPKVGIEPTLPEGNRILSPARLPVPPLRRDGVMVRREPGVDSRTHKFHEIRPALETRFVSRNTHASARDSGPGGCDLGGSFEQEAFCWCAGGAVAVVAVVVAGVAGNARSAAKVSPLPSSSCTPVVYKGSGSPDYIVASDLPLQGAIRHQTVQINRAGIVGAPGPWLEGRRLKIGYQSCDDSTAQAGGWDTAKCATNAHLYAQQPARSSASSARSTRGARRSSSRS